MVVQTHRGQRRIPARTQEGAATAEAVGLAPLPAIAEHHNRRGTVIEIVAREVADRFLRGKRPAPKALALIKSDLRGYRNRRITTIVDVRIVADRSHRRNAVVQAHRS